MGPTTGLHEFRQVSVVLFLGAEANAEAGPSYYAAVGRAWQADQDFLESKGEVIVDFDVSARHEKIIELARGLEAAGKWEKGLVDKVPALEKQKPLPGRSPPPALRGGWFFTRRR